MHIIRPYVSKTVSHLCQGLLKSLSLTYFLIPPMPATQPVHINLLVFYILYYGKISTLRRSVQSKKMP